MVKLGAVTPVLRIFDEAKAREFYVDFLGFTIEFEHRYGDNFPIYMAISHSGCRLHLSEHHGDGSPGAHVRISADDVDQMCKDLSAKDYKFAKPGGGEKTPWGTIEVTITDPFANRLTFAQEGSTS